MDVSQRIGPPGVRRDPALSRVAPATRAEASTLRRCFRTWIADLADPDTADDLALAVYEALANVVDHAYAEGCATDGADRAPEPVVTGDMRLWAAVSPPLTDGRHLVVTVSDDGLWRRSSGCGWRGRGLSLMRTLSDASVYSGSTGTTVQMRRCLAPVPA